MGPVYSKSCLSALQTISCVRLQYRQLSQSSIFSSLFIYGWSYIAPIEQRPCGHPRGTNWWRCNIKLPARPEVYAMPMRKTLLSVCPKKAQWESGECGDCWCHRNSCTKGTESQFLHTRLLQFADIGCFQQESSFSSASMKISSDFWRRYGSKRKQKGRNMQMSEAKCAFPSNSLRLLCAKILGDEQEVDIAELLVAW